ncbi:basic proline-rich protein-like [Erinaceus europaeus]|uniref:Basic proline-rich protein-like n=1 Tax=Erinaceus europaeus TaxID=9365 RepID=A0ABM3W9U2_ERIEU|nr:basic proline-rich protein-like [Erinaceus europaeus]
MSEAKSMALSPARASHTHAVTSRAARLSSRVRPQSRHQLCVACAGTPKHEGHKEWKAAVGRRPPPPPAHWAPGTGGQSRKPQPPAPSPATLRPGRCRRAREPAAPEAGAASRVPSGARSAPAGPLPGTRCRPPGEARVRLGDAESQSRSRSRSPVGGTGGGLCGAVRIPGVRGRGRGPEGQAEARERDPEAGQRAPRPPERGPRGTGRRPSPPGRLTGPAPRLPDGRFRGGGDGPGRCPAAAPAGPARAPAASPRRRPSPAYLRARDPPPVALRRETRSPPPSAKRPKWRTYQEGSEFPPALPRAAGSQSELGTRPRGALIGRCPPPPAPDWVAARLRLPRSHWLSEPVRQVRGAHSFPVDSPEPEPLGPCSLRKQIRGRRSRAGAPYAVATAGPALDRHCGPPIR